LWFACLRPNCSQDVPPQRSSCTLDANLSSTCRDTPRRMLVGGLRHADAKRCSRTSRISRSNEIRGEKPSARELSAIVRWRDQGQSQQRRSLDQDHRRSIHRYPRQSAKSVMPWTSINQPPAFVTIPAVRARSMTANGREGSPVPIPAWAAAHKRCSRSPRFRGGCDRASHMAESMANAAACRDASSRRFARRCMECRIKTST